MGEKIIDYGEENNGIWERDKMALSDPINNKN